MEVLKEGFWNNMISDLSFIVSDNVERLRAGGLTAIERLRGERVRGYKQTAGGYMHDNIQEVRRQR